MSLLTSPAQSCPQLLNSQITRIDCAAHVQDVLDALIAPENSSLRKLARFLQVKERGGNCIRWRAQRMKRGRDVPERLGNMDSGDRLALAFVEWRAHLVRRLQQTIAQLSHLPEDDDSQALGGRGVCHLTVGSFRLPLPHGNSNGSENRHAGHSMLVLDVAGCWDVRAQASRAPNPKHIALTTSESLLSLVLSISIPAVAMGGFYATRASAWWSDASRYQGSHEG